MEFKYSQKLIEETIKCFRDEDNLDISIDTASEYLDSFGGLFLAFANKRTSADSERVAEVSCASSISKVEPALTRPEAGPRSPDLISPHSCNN